jgi:hypothetical protein
MRRSSRALVFGDVLLEKGVVLGVGYIPHALTHPLPRPTSYRGGFRPALSMRIHIQAFTLRRHWGMSLLRLNSCAMAGNGVSLLRRIARKPHQGADSALVTQS